MPEDLEARVSRRKAEKSAGKEATSTVSVPRKVEVEFQRLGQHINDPAYRQLWQLANSDQLKQILRAIWRYQAESVTYTKTCLFRTTQVEEQPKFEMELEPLPAGATRYRAALRVRCRLSPVPPPEGLLASWFGGRQYPGYYLPKSFVLLLGEEKLTGGVAIKLHRPTSPEETSSSADVSASRTFYSLDDLEKFIEDCLVSDISLANSWE